MSLTENRAIPHLKCVIFFVVLMKIRISDIAKLLLSLPGNALKLLQKPLIFSMIRCRTFCFLTNRYIAFRNKLFFKS